MGAKVVKTTNTPMNNLSTTTIRQPTNQKSSLTTNKKYTIHLQLIVLKLGCIDTRNETFYAEFYLESTWFDSKKPPKNLFFNPNLTLTNAIGEPQQEVTISAQPITSHTNHHRLYKIHERRKIHGHFAHHFDFTSFPLDLQRLTIEITSPYPLETCQLLATPTTFTRNAFMDTQQWRLHMSSLTCETSVTRPEVSLQVHSCVQMSVRASRAPAHFLYNAFLLVTLITIVGLTKFSITCSLTEIRLLIDTSVTLTLITFKWVIAAEQGPQCSYLTSLDRYFLFAILFLSLQTFYDSILGVFVAVADDVEVLVVCAHTTVFGVADFWAFVTSVGVLVVANSIVGVWMLVCVQANRKRVLAVSERASEENSLARLLMMRGAYNERLGGKEGDDEEVEEGGVEEESDENEDEETEIVIKMSERVRDGNGGGVMEVNSLGNVKDDGEFQSIRL